LDQDPLNKENTEERTLKGQAKGTYLSRVKKGGTEGVKGRRAI